MHVLLHNGCGLDYVCDQMLILILNVMFYMYMYMHVLNSL